MAVMPLDLMPVITLTPNPGLGHGRRIELSGVPGCTGHLHNPIISHVAPLFQPHRKKQPNFNPGVTAQLILEIIKTWGIIPPNGSLSMHTRMGHFYRLVLYYVAPPILNHVAPPAFFSAILIYMGF